MQMRLLKNTSVSDRAGRATLISAMFLLGALLWSPSLASAAQLDDAAAKYKTIRIERKGPVLIARFSNPPLNTMNSTMVAELSDLLTHVETDPQTRVLV